MNPLKSLPYRIAVVNTCYYVALVEAIELLRLKRAREVYVESEFLGIELGPFGPVPTERDASPMPPAEVANCKFVIKSADQTHAMVMGMVYAGVHGVAEFA